MMLLDCTLPTLEENLALDEALLLEANEGNIGEVLRFWEWPSFAVVLVSGGKVADDVHLPNCEVDGVTIHRRSSGGGTVLLGRGCLLYTLILSYDRDERLEQIHSSYQFILGKLIQSLKSFHIVEQVGISDLAIDGRKFSGNAQQRKRNYLLHHGTILIHMDLSVISRYLLEPPRQPDYREQRPHDEFVCNFGFDVASIKNAITESWEVEAATIDWPEARVAKLVSEKYSLGSWIHRR